MLDPCDGCAYSLEDLLGLVAMLGAGPVRDLGWLDSAAGQLDAAGIEKRLPPVPVAD